MPCPGIDDFVLLAEGALGEDGLVDVERHLAGCERCAEIAATMAAAAPVGDEPALPWLRPGDELGRYRIRSWLGSGGMGHVYAADDPQLGREVALKLVRGVGEAEHEARLIAEARAMARLSHPNVVPVYDAGTVDGRSFIAMERVRGVSLDEWCRTPRPWREVLAMFVGAGRGLAAAHAAGLLHRDFKPANVLVSEDGRALVGDFGLARLAEPAEESEGAAPVTAGSGALTQTGVLVGTPAYMAPEQLRGQALEPRSDQFSFCVALYEALHGQRPFAGSDPRALCEAILSGALRPPPGDTQVPRRLTPVIERGLRAAPADRFDDMNALLAALEAAGRPRRPIRTAVLAAAVIGVALAGIAGSAPAATLGELCGDPESAAARRWSGDRREALEARFAATGEGGAAEAFARFDGAVRSYVDDYVRATRETCIATHVAHAESPELFERRRTCLDERLASVDALLGNLEGADTIEPAIASLAVHRLPPISACRGAAVLGQLTEPPPPAIAAPVATKRRLLWDLEARATLGDVQGALDAALALRGEVEELGYRPLEAEVGLSLARLQARAGNHDDAEATALAALEAAQATGATALSVRLAAELGTLAMRRSAAEDARRWLSLARANAERLGDPPELSRSVLLLEAQLHAAAGDLQAELASRRSVHELSRRVFGDASPLTAVRLGEVAAVESSLGDVVAAAESLEAAHAALIASVGDESNQTLWMAQSLGFAYQQAGRYRDSERIFRRVTATLEATVGPSSPELASAHLNLAVALIGAGDDADDEAIFASLARARDIFVAAGMQAEAAVADVNHATQLLARGRPADARVRAEAAVAGLEATLPADHPRLATARLVLGKTLRQLGDHAGALPLFERAHAVQLARLGPDHPGLVDTLANLGEMLVATGERRAGLAHLERAVALGRAAAGDPTPGSGALHALALAVRDEPARARALLEEARDRLDRDDPHHQRMLTDLDASLARLAASEGR